jgi:hypothetical protein
LTFAPKTLFAGGNKNIIARPVDTTSLATRLEAVQHLIVTLATTFALC